MTPQGLKDRTVLLLISGMSADAAEGFCVSGGATPEQAKEIVSEARNRITVAADYARDEQVGKAVMRLEDLYAKSMAAKDVRAALLAQRELNRLLALYADSRKEPLKASSADPATEAQASVDQVLAYVVPLGLTDPRYPAEEQVRVLVDRLRDLQGEKDAIHKRGVVHEAQGRGEVAAASVDADSTGHSPVPASEGPGPQGEGGL